jgi:hypothetical protein
LQVDSRVALIGGTYAFRAAATAEIPLYSNFAFAISEYEQPSSTLSQSTIDPSIEYYTFEIANDVVPNDLPSEATPDPNPCPPGQSRLDEDKTGIARP